jgi:hypothetical protein
MAGIRWVITFETVQDPVQMKSRLDTSVTLRKCRDVWVRIEGSNVVCSFVSPKSEQNIKKDVGQTFSHYGRYECYTITKNTGHHDLEI